ncbi:hypothetical protein [Paenibacillus prosopidis]|uniref:Uncharacterized protein n=1 Tax=Paenibacillus prosopidis TaxID=630520 RepID=A0A368W8T2_9BACL|nr:hypothetical protein [Paenibacillus prosopidis]RCW52045.1 hypothetical protein DFP97_101391 [Paenibacillus prosopidis]
MIELNGRKLGVKASQKIVASLKSPRKGSKELKKYIKDAFEVSKQVKRK